MPARYAGTRSRPGRLGHGQELTRLWPRSNMLATPARCAGHPLAPAVCAGPEGHSNTDAARQVCRRVHGVRYTDDSQTRRPRCIGPHCEATQTRSVEACPAHCAGAVSMSECGQSRASS